MNGIDLPHTALEDDVYTAGLMDGEGSICLACYHSYYSPRTEMCSVDNSICLWLQSRYGGKVFLNKRKSNTGVMCKQGNTFKKLWVWRIQDRQGNLSFATKIKPFSKMKIKQYDTMIQFLTKQKDGTECAETLSKINIKSRRKINEENYPKKSK